MLPVLEVLDIPEISSMSDRLAKEFPGVFPACVVTRAQSRRFGDMIDLEGTVIQPVFANDEFPDQGQGGVPPEHLREVKPTAPNNDRADSKPVSDMLPGPISVTRGDLIVLQKEDPTWLKCFSSVVTPDEASQRKVAYFIDNGLLMRKWTAHCSDADWTSVSQIVVPMKHRQGVLSLAHDHAWSGHLGITKTYDRVLRHFCWPGLKSSVASFCRTCHICQLMGKPNQRITPAPLHPIPAMGEPFERVIVDCVGPLPKARSGNQFLLTIMCCATRYPEAIPLRRITAKAVIKALIKFLSTFGLPKVLQTDQGSNFTLQLFRNVLKTLAVTHKVSSAYHAESQGALERWHQTLKSMLRKYCMDTQKDWDEGVPLVLFVIREPCRNP